MSSPRRQLADAKRGDDDRSALPGFLHVDHVGLTVSELEPAVSFYCNVLGARELYRMGPFDSAEFPLEPDGRDWSDSHFNVAGARFHFAMLQLGPNLMLELFQYDRPPDRRTQPPRNCDIGGHHLAVKVSNLDEAIAYLKKQKGVAVMAGPVVISEGVCAGLRVIYFLDPWGNQLELVEFNR